MEPARWRRRKRRGPRASWSRLRRPGSPNLWLIVPLFVAAVLIVGWIVGTFMSSDVTGWARGLVRQKSPF